MGGRRITFCDCLETAPHCDSRCLFLHKVYYHFEGRQIWNGEFLAPFEGRLSVQFDLKEIMAVLFVNQQKYFEVINSPCYHNKELASPEQMATVLHGSSPFLGANGLTSPRVNGYLVKAHQTHSCSCGGLVAVQD
ncbi:hypothetical protein Tco_0090062 [Tanacetum coccineum]